MRDKIRLTRKGTNIFIEGIEERAIKIPSQMYPLSGKVQLITSENTVPFSETESLDIRIKEIFDTLQPNLGRCYTNIEMLLSAAKKAGIDVITPYVGWCIVGGTLPVHHCFAAYQGKILDFNIKEEFLLSRVLENNNGELPNNIDSMRKQVAIAYLNTKSVLNSEKSIFGQVEQGTCYIATPCSPMTGLRIYEKLIAAFPNHPAYRNVDKRGASKLQSEIFRAEQIR